MTDKKTSKVQKAKKSLEKLLSGEPGFVGIGVAMDSSGNYEIFVVIEAANSPVVNTIPNEWEGFTVRKKVGGISRKL